VAGSAESSRGNLKQTVDQISRLGKLGRSGATPVQRAMVVGAIAHRSIGQFTAERRLFRVESADGVGVRVG
jgi:hypothetical protein